MSVRKFMSLNGRGLSSRIHTCVVFGGWGGAWSGGVDPIPYDSSGAAIFAEKVRALGLTVRDWQGALVGRQLIEQAFTFVRENFNPRGKLIVYGYSAGGMNALEFAREFERRARVFDGGELVPTQSNETLDSGEDVVIDLLITIDAYRPGVRPQHRRVPRNVQRSINIYQQYAQMGTQSAGGPSHRLAQQDELHDCNQDRTDRTTYKEKGSGLPGGGAHGYIDEDTEQVVFEKVEALVSQGPEAVNCSLR
jgi:hypothetical protein